MDEKNLGQRLKEYRKSLNKTQGQIAKLLDISTDYVSRIELGTRKPSKRIKADIDELISGGIEQYATHRGITLAVNGGSAHVDIHQEDLSDMPPALVYLVDIIKEWDEKKINRLVKMVIEMDLEES